MGEKYIHEFLNAPTYFFGFFLLSVIWFAVLAIAEIGSTKVKISDSAVTTIWALIATLMFASLFWPFPYFLIWVGAKLFGWGFVSIVIFGFVCIIGAFIIAFGCEKMGDRIRYIIFSVLLLGDVISVLYIFRSI